MSLLKSSFYQLRASEFIPHGSRTPLLSSSRFGTGRQRDSESVCSVGGSYQVLKHSEACEISPWDGKPLEGFKLRHHQLNQYCTREDCPNDCVIRRSNSSAHSSHIRVLLTNPIGSAFSVNLEQLLLLSLFRQFNPCKRHLKLLANSHWSTLKIARI